MERGEGEEEEEAGLIMTKLFRSSEENTLLIKLILFKLSVHFDGMLISEAIDTLLCFFPLRPYLYLLRPVP